MGTQPRYVQIAERIYTDAKSAKKAAGYARLEPFRKLSASCQASFGTIKRAVRYLIDDGRCIKKGPRTFFLVWDRSFESLDARTSDNAVEVLAGRIREDILCGNYKTDMQLPKAEYFTLSFNVSSHTVSGAMKQLCGEGLIHKQGRKWIVGNPSSVHHGSTPSGSRFRDSYGSSRPVVIMTVRNPNHYAAVSTSDLYQPFIETLVGELARNAFEVTVCFTDMTDPLYRLVSGQDTIVAHARSLGARYAGAIVIGSEMVYGRGFFAELAALSRPVLWFDNNDESRVRNFGSLAKFRNFFVCRVDQKKLALTAMHFLHECGHRAIGIPDPRPLATSSLHRNWIGQRIADLEAAARSLSPPMSCHSAVQINHPFSYHKHKEKYSSLWRPGAIQPPDQNEGPFQPAESEVFSMLPVAALRHLVEECNVTALCACNDYFARDYFYWLGQAGISVPDRLSLISFDNSCAALPLGVTSVDFGLSYLGYQAAGVLLERIAPPPGKPPTLWSRPWLVQRRSVESPAR